MDTAIFQNCQFVSAEVCNSVSFPQYCGPCAGPGDNCVSCTLSTNVADYFAQAPGALSGAVGSGFAFLITPWLLLAMSCTVGFLHKRLSPVLATETVCCMRASAFSKLLRVTTILLAILIAGLALGMIPWYNDVGASGWIAYNGFSMTVLNAINAPTAAQDSIYEVSADAGTRVAALQAGLSADLATLLASDAWTNAANALQNGLDTASDIISSVGASFLMIRIVAAVLPALFLIIGAIFAACGKGGGGVFAVAVLLCLSSAAPLFATTVTLVLVEPLNELSDLSDYSSAGSATPLVGFCSVSHSGSLPLANYQNAAPFFLAVCEDARATLCGDGSGVVCDYNLTAAACGNETTAERDLYWFGKRLRVSDGGVSVDLTECAEGVAPCHAKTVRDAAKSLVASAKAASASRWALAGFFESTDCAHDTLQATAMNFGIEARALLARTLAAANILGSLAATALVATVVLMLGSRYFGVSRGETAAASFGDLRALATKFLSVNSDVHDAAATAADYGSVKRLNGDAEHESVYP